MALYKKHTFWLWSVIIIQVVLVFIGYNKLIIDGQDHLFMNAWDGMRNYFAYQDYITQGPTSDYFLFEKMNYPFGDYIFYTDNTPFLAVSVKWFSENIYDVSNYSFQIFHWFLTFILVFTSIVQYLICKEFIQTKWLIAIFSIAIPWLSPQLFRLGFGHFNLSLTICFLLIIYALIKLYQNYETSPKKIWKPILGMMVTALTFSFFHIYYLWISAFLIAYFCFFWAVFNRKKRKDFLKILAIGGSVPLALFGIFLLILRSIDTYYLDRNTTANGFHKHDWQFKIEALYASHDFLTLPSFINVTNHLPYETIGYLGSFSIYGGLFFLLFYISKKCSKRLFKSYFITPKFGQLALILFWTGFFCLWISFGSYARFFNHLLAFDNWFNPLYWLENIVPQVTQFRCMARFSWIFFLTFNLFLLYLLDQYYQRNRNHWLRLSLVILLPLFLTIDTIDTVKWSRQFGAPQPLNNSPKLDELSQLLAPIDIKKYQAILPLPYYHSSCEDYDYTIDPENLWCTTTYQLSTLSDLPLMASKIGRSPLNQTYALFDIVLQYQIPKLVAERLTEQPILVAFNQREAAWTHLPNLEPARTALLNGKVFPEKMKLKEISRLNDWILYEWNWQNNVMSE